MPLITGGVKDIVRYARLGLFQAHTEDLRLKWIILGETLKVRLQEVLFQAFTRSPDSIQQPLAHERNLPRLGPGAGQRHHHHQRHHPRRARAFTMPR